LFIKNIGFSARSVPIAIFMLCALAFGPLIFQLGFYWDDWPVILVAHLKGDFWEYYTYNRPASAWSHAFVAPVLGTSPLNWHLFGEVSWALIAISFWGMLQQLWPTRKRENVVMALLFAVHPIYLIHPIAVTFIQHNLTYIPFFISFGAMLTAMRKPHWFWPLTMIGILTNLIHAFSMEYFWGLELVRPVLIILVLGETTAKWRQRILPTLKIWLPYLAATGMAIIWRVFFAQLAESDPNELVLLGVIRENPVSGLIQLVQTGIQDFVYLLVVRWYDTLQIAWLDLSDRFGLFAWGMGMVAAGSFWVYFRQLERKDVEGAVTPSALQPIFVGIFAIMAGGLSVWLAGRQLTIGLFADRFALPMLVGVVMLTVGLIEVIVRPGIKPIIFAILIGLSVAAQLRTQNDYRWDWVNQQRAFWQLYWRAPALEEHTAVFSDGTLFRYTGGYPTASALNVLYPQRDDTNELDYWFLELDRGYFRYLPEMIAEDFPIKEVFRQYTFSSTSRQSLVVFYEPDLGNCLWVMRESDRFNPDIPALTKEAVPISNLSRILVAEPGVPLDAQVFGEEPAHTWCYFYQKAELARQQEDWVIIVALAEESAVQGFSPNNRLEWLPFVEAFAHTGDWARAMDLSMDALEYSKSTRNLFCPIWRGFEQEGLDAPPGTFSDAYRQLECEVGVDN
jgi:hypothetical protein